MSAGDAEIRDALFMADEIANCRRKRGEEGALEESSYGFRMTKEEVNSSCPFYTLEEPDPAGVSGSVNYV